MRVLVVHQNFPGQYLHLVQRLVTDGHEVVFVTQRSDARLPGVRHVVYRPNKPATTGRHHYLTDLDPAVLNGQAVARVALELKRGGFVPDIMLGHNGWGEIWFLKDVFPNVPLLGYFEFFYRIAGADVGFDPADPGRFDDGPRLRIKNAGNLIGLDAADWGQCPTRWQQSLYPPAYQATMSVVHEGVDTDRITPDARAELPIPGSTHVLHAGDEVVTYVARNLEPYRGFQVFMRSLPGILRRRPGARVVIVGADGVSYGQALPPGETWKQRLLDELGSSLDLSRVHFLGAVPHPVFVRMLQVSRVHVYLTYPFVLSWSMLEAMSAGCMVVASNTQPVQEVIRHDEQGWLVDFFDVAALTESVVRVLSNPQDSQRLRAAARQAVIERYDLRAICLPAQLALLSRLARRDWGRG